MTLALIAEADTINDQHLWHQHNDWRFYQSSIS